MIRPVEWIQEIALLSLPVISKLLFFALMELVFPKELIARLLINVQLNHLSDVQISIVTRALKNVSQSLDAQLEEFFVMMDLVLFIKAFAQQNNAQDIYQNNAQMVSVSAI